MSTASDQAVRYRVGVIDRGVPALGASVLAGLAAVISSLDGDPDYVPFFVGLTVLGGMLAWAVTRPGGTVRRWITVAVAGTWTVAALWVGALLFMAGTVWQSSSTASPGPEATYLGLTATVYHVLGLYGGWILVMVAAARPVEAGKAAPD